MSKTTTLAGKLAAKDTPSTTAPNNPFDTLFDGAESEEEWWDEEDSVESTTKATTAVQVSEWPRTSESTGAVAPAKPIARTSTRKLDKRYSVQKPTRDKSKGRQRKQNALAGIKVMTNFTRQQGAQAPVQLQPSKNMPHMGRFVDMAALKALTGESTQDSGGFWKSRKKGQTQAANTVPSMPKDALPTNRRSLRAMLPSPIKLEDDLSPNDRPIVIGISIPSGDMAEHTLSPQTATSESSRIVRSYEHRNPTSHTPDTPTIIITPAQESPAWSSFNQNSSSPNRRPYPASSIYSQAPQNAMGIYANSSAPPVPQMPASVLEEERQRVAGLKSCFSPDSDDGTTWEDDDTERDAGMRSRVVSSYTVFEEEDESPIVTRTERAVSISAKSAKHASINTVATRRHSKGWWNYITTPFLTRSNTVASRGVFEDQQPPALPSLAIAAAKAQEAERDGTMWEKQFSPLTPETANTVRPDSWWNSISKDDEAKQIKSTEQSPVLHETRHKVQRSSATIPFVFPEIAGFGGSTLLNTPSSNAESEPDRSMSELPHSRSGPGFTPTERSAPLLSQALHIREVQSNNPYVQPQGGLNDSNNIQSATRQAIQPIRATVVQAPVRPQQSPADAPPPPYSPSPSRIPRFQAVFPPGHSSRLQYPPSPGPLSPGMQQAMSSGGDIPMSNVPLTPPPRRPINLNSGYPELPARQAGRNVTIEDLAPPSKKAQKAETKRRRHEKEDAIARRAGGWWRGRGCIPQRGCYGRSGAEGRKRRRWYIFLITGFLSVMIVIIALATTLHRKSNVVVGPSQWLNLTGFPPIYAGLSTVAAPVNIMTSTGCVFPATQWSCDLPKELQASVTPNQPNQPNFRLEIQWDNSSSTNATFANVTGNPHLITRTLVGNPVSAGQFIKRMLLRGRQIVTFVPNPAPPSYAEELFLGNTTDGIVSANKAGEPTPFYISFLQPTNSSNLPTKRQILERKSSTDPFPNVTDFIPAPSLNQDSTAAPANLLPFPIQQPIRLYDRGLPTEHYGFYTYFDRSIFLKSLTKLNSTNADNGEVPDDENGGAKESEATFRCTWAETRFLVQMWTRMNSTARLNNGTASTSPSPGTDFIQPGSFPYPITITTDRHGGDPALKMLYCYEMNDREGIISSSGQLNAENRGFGGTAINPAPQIFSNASSPTFGGFDGGTGGCSCQWSNFVKVTST